MGIERKIGRLIAQDLRRLAKNKGLNFGDVVLTWRVPSTPGPGYDPNLRGSGGAMSYPEQSLTLRALIHTVSIHTTGFVKHAEVMQGDLILDFIGDAPLDGKEDLRFTIDGGHYVQKKAGGDLAKSWDVRCHGIPVTRTVLVTRAG